MLLVAILAIYRFAEDWSIENCWHWPRDSQLKEDAHSYREANGVQILATLRSLAMNALRLERYWSTTDGLAALAHDIRGLLALLGWREPTQQAASGYLLISPAYPWRQNSGWDRARQLLSSAL